MKIIKRIFSQSNKKKKDGPYHLSVHCGVKEEKNFTVIIEQQGIGCYDCFDVYYLDKHINQKVINKIIEKGCKYNPFVKAYNKIALLPNKPPQYISLGLLPDKVFDQSKFWDILPGSKEWEIEHFKGAESILEYFADT